MPNQEPALPELSEEAKRIAYRAITEREVQLRTALSRISSLESLVREMREGHINSATHWPCSKTPNTDTRCEWCKRVDSALGGAE